MAALKIQYKLFVAMFTWSTVLIVVLAMSIQKSLDLGMIDYVNQREVDNIKPLIDILGDHYVKTGNWDAYDEATGKFRRLLGKELFSLGPPSEPHHMRLKPRPNEAGTGPKVRPPRDSKGPPKGPPDKDGFRPGMPHSDDPRLPPFRRGDQGPLISYVLLNENKELVAGFYPEDREYTYVEIKPLGDVVGYFAVSKRNELADGYELNFLDQQQEQLIAIGSILLLATFALTLPFARHLVQPIKLVASSLSQLSGGKYDTKLETKRSDEFQLLFKNINNLAKTLAENETARKKWFADTAHDLRTPIAIMRGELEAMLDGVRKMDADQIESIHGETMRLQRFINDLHELARSELGTQHYQKHTVDLNGVILDVASHCTQLLSKQGIELQTQLPDKEVLLLADEFRLAQCLDNLMTNIANYAHGASKALIRLEKETEILRISIEDDGEGVPDEHLGKLFDHLYRVEGSRNRNTGGSGLGLAICKNIIAAHDGTIVAEKSALGGLAIVIALPCA